MLRMHLNPFPQLQHWVHVCTKNLRISPILQNGPTKCYPNSTNPTAILCKLLLSVWVASIILTSFIPGTQAQENPRKGFFVPGAQAQENPPNGLCTSKYIRNNPNDLERLTGCRVIEGDLQISLIDQANSTSYANLSFPELREITGYFLLSLASGLQSLRGLFPNLAVIRGQSLVHNYAFLISDMPDMHEIGLPKLTNIFNRGVYISGNPNLCYVDTVDWDRITNDSKVNFIQKNSDRCPNLCPDNCPKPESHNSHLCWSNRDCQIVHRAEHCGGRPSAPNGECCDEHCLGGCKGPEPSNCHVCKTLEIPNENSPDRKGIVCISICPHNTYEYMNRRCVTEDECHNITSIDVKKKEKLRGIRVDNYNGRDVCVLECPKGYTVLYTENGLKTCKPCNGPCKKECPATYVDSVESSVQLKGCTTIIGTLKIQIRGYVRNLVKELESNMDMIEDIHGSLVVSNSLSLSSLSFLKSLKKIHGKTLEEQTYAVVVKSNENLQELWNRDNGNHVEVLQPTARVLFHMNPKLCPQKIREFVQHSKIDTKDDIDIGVTNGDKIPCNQKKLNLRIVSRVNNSVTLKWENFRRNLTDPRLLLNYEIFYRISAEQNASVYEDRDPCGGDDWKIIDVPKLVFKGSQDEEPLEQESIITNLKYYTQYAVYVKTVVIPDNNSPNNNTAAVSDVKYFTTLPGVPSQPRDVTIVSNSSNGIIISWLPPDNPNGLIEKYTIYLKEEIDDLKFQDQRDYCLQGRPDTKLSTTSSKESTGGSSFIQQILDEAKPDGKECCTCNAVTPKPKQETSKHTIAYLEQAVQDAILNAVFIENPDYKEPVTNETESNEGVNKSNRRRKREIISPNLVDNDTSLSDDSKEIDPIIMFPDNFVQGEHVPLKHTGMQVYAEVWANETNISGRLKPIYFLTNLTHFTKYTIGITACRNISLDIQNDSRTCSDMVKDSVTTLYSETADMVDVDSIFINVTGNEVYAKWNEPLDPNGIVMSYKVNVTRVDVPKTATEPPHIICVTRKTFNDTGRNFKFPKSLHPGNYSFMIQTVSLAADSNYTLAKYFIIDSVENGMSTGNIIAIILPIIILLILTGAFIAYCVRTRRLVDKITSANPEYLANIDIPEEWELLRDKIDVKKELGSGSFGVVYAGEIRDYKGKGRIKCAIKEVAKSAPSEDRFRFLQEAAIMTQLDCHHVIKLLGVVSLSQPTWVIMELMVTDLKKYLRERRPDDPDSIPGEQPPTLRQILRMAAGIADGMAYLDSKGFVHRDLAARNCMVAEDMTVKVGDFGMTKDTDYYRKSTRGLLPVRWMAPESIKDGIFTIQSDLWSFGVVLWEMATLAAQPYQGLNNDQVIRYVRDGGIMERPENCPEVLYNIMIRCWAYRAPERPTFSQILDWLESDLDTSFRQISFYHSSAGAEYKANLRARPENRIITSRTPLRATFDEDLNSEGEEDDLIESGSDEEAPHQGTEDHHAMLGNSPRYKPAVNGAGTNTPYSMSDLPSSFTLPQSTGTNTPPHSSSSCSPPLNPTSHINNNTTSPGFITLDLNHGSPQDSFELNKRSSLSDSQSNSTPPRLPNKYSVQTNGPSIPKSSPDSSDGLSIHYSSADTGSVKLCNGIEPPIKHLSGIPANCGYRTTPATGGNGILPSLRFDPSSSNLYLKKTNSTTQF